MNQIKNRRELCCTIWNLLFQHKRSHQILKRRFNFSWFYMMEGPTHFTSSTPKVEQWQSLTGTVWKTSYNSWFQNFDENSAVNWRRKTGQVLPADWTIRLGFASRLNNCRCFFSVPFYSRVSRRQRSRKNHWGFLKIYRKGLCQFYYVMKTQLWGRMRE